MSFPAHAARNFEALADACEKRDLKAALEHCGHLCVAFSGHFDPHAVEAPAVAAVVACDPNDLDGCATFFRGCAGKLKDDDTRRATATATGLGPVKPGDAGYGWLQAILMVMQTFLAQWTRKQLA